VTADVIDRAIKRGAGLDTDTSRVEEIFYEGYAAGGVGVIVRALTDNRNRTASSIRHIFSAFGGNLGETGSVSGVLFDYKGQIVLTLPEDVEAFEMHILETDAEDYTIEASSITVITDRTELINTKNTLKTLGYTVESSGFAHLPKHYVEVTDEEVILKIYTILEAFSDDEDVEAVWNNADIADELWTQAAETVEANRFRT